MEYIRSINNLLFPTENLCYFCKDRSGIPVDYTCNECRERLDIVHRKIEIDSLYINTAYYSLIYNKYMREMIKGFKFHGRSYLYKPFSEIMVDTIERSNINNIDLIIYVPSYRRKEAIRGYNQSQLLAKYISGRINVDLSINNLIKTKATKDQSSLSRSERMNNLKDSISLRNSSEIKDKKILLVDDIITTGTTMIQCAEVLMKNEAKEVIGLALTSSKKL